MLMNPHVEHLYEAVQENLPIETIKENDVEKQVIVFEKDKDTIEYMYLSAVSEMDYVYFSKLIEGFWQKNTSLKQIIKDKDKATGSNYFNILKGQLMTRSLKDD